MSGDYLPLLLFLIFVAAFLRDDFAFTLVYLLIGVFLVGNWWSRQSLSGIKYKRNFYTRAFLGEKINVDLEINNTKWLPIPWLRIREGLPVQLSGPDAFNRVFTLSPKAKEKFSYTLEARKRGYYPIGPLFISTGDLMGLGGRDLYNEGHQEYLTVYPKVVQLIQLKIPSHSPMGTLAHTQPVFEDPTRVIGKRDYVIGDSLRQVDWKTSASTGRMQVKVFEPSIALETLIFLDLDGQSYHYKARIDATELGIVISASIANWIIEKGQTVGFCSNGEDPLAETGRTQSLPSRRGKGHLIRVLETLARIQAVESGEGIARIIQKQRVHLPWGTTLIVITGTLEDDLLNELYQVRRSGQNVVLIIAGRAVGVKDIQARARFFGVPVIPLANENDLEQWGRGQMVVK